MARRRPRCLACGATWSPSARFCGVCGDRLAVPRRSRNVGAYATRVPAGVLALGITALFAVLGAWAWVAGGGMPSEPVDRDLPVDLPQAEPLPVGSQRPQVRCVPPGCERWTVEVGHGRTRALASGVYHTTRDSLLAVDPLDGSIRWRATLARPGARLLAAGDHLEGAESRLLFTSDLEGLQVWDSGTGQLWWEVEWPGAWQVSGFVS